MAKRTMVERFMMFSCSCALAMTVGVGSAQQPGGVDLSFNPGDLGNNAGDGANAWTRAVVVQPDGKVLIAGQFTEYNGVSRTRIARLNANGSLDHSFDPGNGANARVWNMALQPDGKCLIVGEFTAVGGALRYLIARLNADGTIDPTFTTAQSVSGGAFTRINALALQPDGKVLIAGDFEFVGVVPRNGVARLNADGTLDPTFDPGGGTSGNVLEVSLQSDGKVLVGGSFTTFNGGTHEGVVRLLPNGDVDPSFVCDLTNTMSGQLLEVYAMRQQPDGRILIGGNYSHVNGISRTNIARVNSDGTLDTTFDPGSGPDLFLGCVALQPGGEILISGWFQSYDGSPIRGVARLLSDGTLDPSFDHGGTTLGSVDEVFLQPDGKIMAVGNINQYGGYFRNNVVRINADGTLDLTFNMPSGADGTVLDIAVQPNGRSVIAGAFNSYFDVPRPRIARLNTDGSLDTTFDPGSGASGGNGLGGSCGVVVQPDGKIIFGSYFTSFNGAPYKRIVRLNADGSVDGSFDPGTGASADVHTVALQPDGKVLVGGAFTSFDGTPQGFLARLMPDGSLDTTFFQGNPVGSTVHDLVLQPDGKIVAVGNFGTAQGVTCRKIARLNSDGTLDPTFTPAWGANGQLYKVALRPDGKLLVGGVMTTYDFVSRPGVARLNTDGTLDPTFLPGAGASQVLELELQPDGKVLLGGTFITYDGVPRSRICRLNADGSLDTDFDPGSGASNAVSGLALQADGAVLIGGSFVSVDGIGRNRIARLFGGNLQPPLLLAPKAFLGGPFDAGFMHDSLRAGQLMPLSEPYTALGYSHVGGGGEAVAPSVLSVTGNDAIVDWMVVELRDGNNPALVLATKSALVQRDGDVVDMDGVSPVSVFAPPGSYHVALQHRNHLGVMTGGPIPLSPSPTVIDLTDPATPTYGLDAQDNVNGTMVCWPGDATFDGVVKYAGANNDRDPVLQAIGGLVPTNVVTNVYDIRDMGMDGNISYVGAGNDRDIVLETIGGTVPTATRFEQLP